MLERQSSTWLALLCSIKGPEVIPMEMEPIEDFLMWKGHEWVSLQDNPSPLSLEDEQAEAHRNVHLV